MTSRAIGRKGQYGFDAPYVPVLMTLGSLPLLLGALSGLLRGDVTAFFSMGVSAMVLVLGAASYLYATRVGKFRCWDDVIDGLALRGDEQVLDLGCGRGAVLLLAAERLRAPAGRATGIDLWQVKDQSGNAADATRRNAEAEGVADRVDLHTGDMRKLPFDAAAFDLIVSSLAIHNIPTADGRAAAIREAVRVLRPGGRVAIADFRFTGDYARELGAGGLRDVRVESLGWRFWYGGPWAATRLVSARKPAPTWTVTPSPGPPPAPRAPPEPPA